jgi:hypothetical protein
MKIFKYPSVAALALCMVFGCLASCRKFLEEDPKNLVAESNYYTTQDDAISAVNSVYAYLGSTSTGTTAGVYHSSFWVAIGLASDNMANNQAGAPDMDQLANFTYGPQNATLLDIWQKHYKTITIANIAITRIPRIDMDTVLRSRLVNEARFLRGLLYFNLVRMFGSVPLLVKEDPPVDPKPASVDDIYNQITEDLSAAEALPASYPVGNGRGRATSGAAKAILAKVYLTRKNYQQAAALAKEVIDSKQYSLWADFADVFKLSSRNGKEAIFSVGFGDGGGKISFWEVGQFLVRLLPKELSAEGVQNAQGWQIPTQALYDSYNPDDQRRTVTFITDVHNSDGSITHIRPYIRKYWDSAAEPQGNGTANDFPVIRYADVLLMYAEAMNELGNTAVALDYLNQVHRRAYGYPVDQPSPVDYTGLSQDALRKAIWQERRWEFVAEGQEWFMLARSGTLETAVPLAKPGVTPQQKNYLFPLPQRELDLNANLKQNTGY